MYLFMLKKAAGDVSTETAVKLFRERKDVAMSNDKRKQSFLNLHLQLLPLLFRLFREELVLPRQVP